MSIVCPPHPTLDGWIEDLCQTSGLAELLAWQEKMARATILQAREKSPFYAEHLAGVSPTDLNTPGWLSRLPFTNTDTLSTQGARMLCVPAREVSRIRSIPTSGSTGPAKRVWFTTEDLARTVAFFAVGMRPLVNPHGTVAIFMSNQREGSVASVLAEALACFGARARFCGQINDADEAALLAKDADCFVGLPTEMLYLCRKHPTLRPKTVLLSADYLPPGLATALEKEWGCRVFSHYGLTETGYGLAVQCHCLEGHHLRMADFLVEIIHPNTGENLPPNTEGEVVLTSLRSEALPLVRYRTGDIASLMTAPCACGSAFPRLGMVRGRQSHLSQRVNIHRLDDLLLPLPGLCGVQAAWDGETLCLLVDGPALPVAALEETLGCPLRVEYTQMPPGKHGKREIAAHPRHWDATS